MQQQAQYIATKLMNLRSSCSFFTKFLEFCFGINCDKVFVTTEVRLSVKIRSTVKVSVCNVQTGCAHIFAVRGGRSGFFWGRGRGSWLPGRRSWFPWRWRRLTWLGWNHFYRGKQTAPSIQESRWPCLRTTQSCPTCSSNTPFGRFSSSSFMAFSLWYMP